MVGRTYEYEVLIVNAKNNKVAAGLLSNSALDLSKLGAVTRL